MRHVSTFFDIQLSNSRADRKKFGCFDCLLCWKLCRNLHGKSRSVGACRRIASSDVSLDYEEQEFIIICTERICDNR